MSTTHVIFDFAGTLIDVVPDTIEFLLELAKKYNVNLSSQQFADLGELDSVSEFLIKYVDMLTLDSGSHQSISRDELIKVLYKAFLSKEFPICSGSLKLIKHLYNNNIPMAIATNLKRPEFMAIAGNSIGFDLKYFSHYITGGDDPDVINNKPAPDIYLVCSERFKIPPKSLENCVVFEDSNRGITGAIASGMKTVLIGVNRCSEDNTIADKITVKVDSFDNFRPESVGLPPYPN